jgi:hypothetical protein
MAFLRTKRRIVSLFLSSLALAFSNAAHSQAIEPTIAISPRSGHPSSNPSPRGHV